MVRLIDHHVVLAARCQREKPMGLSRRMATRILYTTIFLENFRHGNVGTEIAWYGFLRNSELSLFIIRCSMLLISYRTQNGRLVISVQSQIPCAKRSHKKRNEAFPDSLWSKFPNIKSHPTPVGWFSTKLQVLDLGKPCAWRRNRQKEGSCCESCGCFWSKKSCLYTTNGAFLGKKQEKTALETRKHKSIQFCFQIPLAKIDTSLGTVPYPRFQPAL